MRVSILTLFPEFFESPLACSILGRAQTAGHLSVDTLNLRDFGDGKYRAVDDKPYGGGVGMVMMPQVLEHALGNLLGGLERVDQLETDVRAFRNNPEREAGTLPHVVYLSPQGRTLSSATARRLSKYQYLVLLCGHYEGIDERATSSLVHEEISIGDYVLTGGEPAGLVVIDAIARFIPGVVGEMASVESDTFEVNAPDMVPGGLKYPMFTRPAEWRGQSVPEVLLSGNHGEIAKWRRAASEARTRDRRPDLIPAGAASLAAPNPSNPSKAKK
ncbi:MAG: tRNA (guanosine(37)-N1)-methyltransferase TrmD [Deltaproteobacteria bacterium]|nr:tRNA (guanosine(37)-N1)-methyltransferase TrmD [Deltaproteobacteria bacterium]